MKFRCTNNDELDGILTVEREYAGEMAYHRDFVKIFKCDDGHPGFFEGNRFQEVVKPAPVVTKINHYFVEVEKR